MMASSLGKIPTTDEWHTTRRHMSQESFVKIVTGHNHLEDELRKQYLLTYWCYSRVKLRYSNAIAAVLAIVTEPAHARSAQTLADRSDAKQLNRTKYGRRKRNEARYLLSP